MNDHQETSSRRAKYLALLTHVGLVAIGVCVGVGLKSMDQQQPSPSAGLDKPSIDSTVIYEEIDSKLDSLPEDDQFLMPHDLSLPDGYPAEYSRFLLPITDSPTAALMSEEDMFGDDGQETDDFEEDQYEEPDLGDDYVAEDDEDFSEETIEEEKEEEEQDDEDLVIDEMSAEPTEMELDTPDEIEQEGNVTVTVVDYDRKLMMNHNHEPLACNSELATASCTNSFNDLVASHDTSTKLTIPCGQCYIVDITDDRVLDLAGGMSIEGKLYFPSTASLTIRTKFVWVIGVLKMDTPEVDNLVKFMMYGDELQTYENPSAHDVCGAESMKGACTMGSKVIAVMGGVLDIKGIEDNCPSWEKLTALGEGTLRPFAPPCEGENCWSSTQIELTGSCRESAGHTSNLGKYTVYCPIKSTGAHIGKGSSTAIKFTSQEPEPFVAPSAAGQELSLQLAGRCSKAGHTNHFNKCVVFCPLKETANVPTGHAGALTFTSVKNEVPFQYPVDGRGNQLSLAMNGGCGVAGHTRHFGKCTLFCRLRRTANIPQGHADKMIFKSVKKVEPFVYPKDRGGKQLSLQLAGGCSVAGHTRHFKKCTLWCPLKSTALVRHGHGAPLTFTSRKTDVSFQMPKDTRGVELELDLASKCINSKGHTNAWGRCVMRCQIDQTPGNVRGGTGYNQLEFTSVYEAPPDFQPPTRNGIGLKLTKRANINVSWGHSRRWNTCVLYVPLERQWHVRWGNGKPMTFTNSRTGEDFRVRKVMHWAWGGWNSYIYPEGYSKDTCGQAAAEMNAIFQKGDTMDVSYYVEPGYEGNTFSIDRVLTWAHARRYMFVLPSEKSKATCDATVSDFNSKFKPGYNIKVDYPEGPEGGEQFTVSGVHHWSWARRYMFFFPENSDVASCGATAQEFNQKFPTNYAIDVSYPEGAPGEEEVEVDGVHHWAWRGNTMFFFPSESDPSTCAATAADFNSKFSQNYEIDISYPPAIEGGETFEVDRVHHWSYNKKYMYFFPKQSDPGTCQATAEDFSAKFPTNYNITVAKAGAFSTGVEALASKGVHHYSWNQNSLYFHPDETAEEFNTKFPIGSKLTLSNHGVYDYNEIKVSPDAAQCWKPGTDLLLTSHTRSPWDDQVRKIKEVTSTGSLILDQPIKKPVTLSDSTDFAVEVASLSRRIVFDAEPDANDSAIGGHIVVHHTSAGQSINGIEIRNFGQQGRLGKYPIHFHMCGDSPDSLVSKNVVRNSNQRGYVVHLTNKVELQDNVAYDVTGHCYFIEDGAETGNIFRRNLGARVKIMPQDRVNQLSASSKRQETDGSPNGFNGASVFWISNPMNYFYDNVAAGGAKNGYWFETHGSRMHMNLGAFEGNEVHSSGRFALTVYSPGWRPRSKQTFRNNKVYRNGSWGAFLHATVNVDFEGGLFADNWNKDVMISRGDNHVFKDVTFIGQTPYTPKHRHCNGVHGGRVGIHLDPVRFQETVIRAPSNPTTGAIVDGSKFFNYSSSVTDCGSYSTPFKFFSHQTFTKAFSAPHYMIDVETDTPAKVEACMPGSTIDDVAVEIVSDTNKALTPTGTPGFLVSPKFTPFLGDCQAHTGCLKFCEGACLRTVAILTGNAAHDDDIIMIVKNQAGVEITIDKEVRGHPQPQPKNNRFASSYYMSLPEGSYELRFESKSNPGVLQWPKYAKAHLEAAPTCSNTLSKSDLTFIKPTATAERCSELVYNGNFESTSWTSDGWYPRHHGLTMLATGGVDGSGAIQTSTMLRNSNWLTQNLDTTCITAGDVFDVSFTYKVIAGDASGGVPAVKISNDWNVAKASSFVAGEWVTATGTWTPDANDAGASVVKLEVYGGNQKIILDNVSVTKTGRRKLRSA